MKCSYVHFILAIAVHCTGYYMHIYYYRMGILIVIVIPPHPHICNLHLLVTISHLHSVHQQDLRPVRMNRDVMKVEFTVHLKPIYDHFLPFRLFTPTTSCCSTHQTQPFDTPSNFTLSWGSVSPITRFSDIWQKRTDDLCAEGRVQMKPILTVLQLCVFAMYI